MTNKQYWYWLCNIEGIGIKKINALLDYFQKPEHIYHAKENELNQIRNLTRQDKKNLYSKKDPTIIKENYDKLKKSGIYFVTKEEDCYPKRLKNLYDAPIALYVKGKLPSEDMTTIAIIGARNCTNYGKEVAKYFAKELSKEGIQIISGLAIGIDSYAHLGTLLENGSTYGILGCGIDICYPEQNIELYMKMQNKGGIISEYGFGISPRPGNFPMRNRIISGLSDGILVIEAKEKSGSLITVDMGLEQGKNIYAIPGRVTDTLSLGCNNLIKMGAELITNPSEILKDYSKNFDYKRNEYKKNDNMLESKEKIVYAILSLEPKHFEEIMYASKLSIHEVMQVLLNLELKNYIKQVAKNYYVILIE